MTDSISPEQRSWNMSRIRSKNSKPEMIVRSMLHEMGYRFRLHRKDLPGSPDIVLPRYMTVILVHGCFWHRHSGCKNCYTPKSNVKFWLKKFKENTVRDAKNIADLKLLGWRVILIWECETQKDNFSEILIERLSL